MQSSPPVTLSPWQDRYEQAYSHIKRQTKRFPVITITGPRQSGATTLAKSAFPDKPYLTLEDPDTRSVAEDACLWGEQGTYAQKHLYHPLAGRWYGASLATAPQVNQVCPSSSIPLVPILTQAGFHGLQSAAAPLKIPSSITGILLGCLKQLRHLPLRQPLRLVSLAGFLPVRAIINATINQA